MAVNPLQLSREVYANATQLFAKQHTTDERKRRWITANSNFNDIETAVLAAKAQYEGRVHSPVRKALANFSATFMYYSKIGDMFAQQHPEYTSLAWGTMKLLFVLALNHEETLTKLAESLTSIAETLPRVDMHLNLYPTPMMRRNVEELYALLIKFFHRTLRWYSAGPFKHLVKSFTRPYSLEFADILARMDTRARSIDSLAVAMAHDELRAMFHLIKGDVEEQKRFRSEFAKIWPALVGIQGMQTQTDQQIRTVQDLVLDHQKVNSGAIQQTRMATVDLQITMMINEAKTEHLLRPHESLHKRLAINRRKSFAGRLKLTGFWKASELATWNQVACSSLLLVRGTTAFRNEIDSAAVLMTDLVLQQANVPIIWALKSSRAASTECSTIDLIKYLAMQAMQFDPIAIGHRVSGHFNASRIASATTEQDWLEILTVILSSFPVAYIVIDIEFLGVCGRDREDLRLLLRIIQKFVCRDKKTVVKVAVLGYRKTTLDAAIASLPNLQQTYSIQFGKLLRSIANARMVRGAREQLAFKRGIAMHSRAPSSPSKASGRM